MTDTPMTAAEVRQREREYIEFMFSPFHIYEMAGETGLYRCGEPTAPKSDTAHHTLDDVSARNIRKAFE